MSRPRGRPKLKDEDRRSEPVGVRLTPAVRKQLEEARHNPDGDRTLSQEIELRLRRSFDFDHEIMKRFGSSGAYAFLRMVADGVGSVEHLCSDGYGQIHAGIGDDELRWLDDRFTFDQVATMINELLSYLRPAGRSERPKNNFENPDAIGKYVAETLVMGLAVTTLKDPAIGHFWSGEATNKILTAAALPLLRRFFKTPAALKKALEMTHLGEL